MPRKGRNIYKRKDGRWEGRLLIGRWPDGRTRYASVYGKTFRETKDKLEKRMISQASKPVAVADKLTVKDLMEKWLFLRSTEVKESTYQHYESNIECHINPLIGGIRVCNLTVEIVTNFTRMLQNSGRADGRGGLSEKTVSDVLCLFRSALRMADRQYGIGNRILQEVKIPPVSKKRIEILGETECQELTKSIVAQPSSKGIAILFALCYGLRVGEVCGLKWSDIDFEERTISVNRTVIRLKKDGKSQLTVQTPKTDSASRIIPIAQEMLDLLERLGGSRKSDAFILTSSSTKPMEPRTLEAGYHAYLSRHGLQQHTFHALRHTFATRAIEKGYDAKAVSEILGHKNVRTTLDLYVHPSMSHKRQIVEALSVLSV